MKKFILSILFVLLLPILNALSADPQTYYSWRCPSNRCESTDCKSLTNGKFSDLCFDTTENKLYKCSPGIDGVCNTSTEWLAAVPGEVPIATSTVAGIAKLSNSYTISATDTAASSKALVDGLASIASELIVYPGAGIPLSTGSSWGTSYTTNGSGTVLALTQSPTLTTPTIAKLANLTSNGIVRTSGSDGSLSVDLTNYLVSETDAIALAKIGSLTSGNICRGTGTQVSCTDNSVYLTQNQTIALGGILSGSGSNSITASAGTGYYMPSTADQSTWNSKLSSVSVSHGVTGNGTSGSPLVIDNSVYQEKLISGSSIKTINGTSVLGAGNISVSSGGGIPGGLDTQIQYNNGGVFGGIDGFIYNGTSLSYSGNIGIGSTSPRIDLDINGTEYIKDSLYLGSTKEVWGEFGDFHGLHISTSSGLAVSTTDWNGVDTGSMIVMQYLPTEVMPETFMMNAFANGIASSGTILMVAKDVLLNSMGSGNVGIGAAVTKAKLDVDGSVYIGGNLGINTTDPVNKLQVNGTMQAERVIASSEIKSGGSTNPGCLMLRDYLGVGWTRFYAIGGAIYSVSDEDGICP